MNVREEVLKFKMIITLWKRHKEYGENVNMYNLLCFKNRNQPPILIFKNTMFLYLKHEEDWFFKC